MNTDYARWEKYLLYIVLTRTIRGQNYVEKASRFFNCYPSTYVDSEQPHDGLSSNFDVEFFDGKEKLTTILESSISNPLVCKTLLEDFVHIDTEHQRVVENFLENPLFCDAILSFLGFASSVILQNHGTTHYEIDTLVSTFNDRALSFFCIQLDAMDVKYFLDICGRTLGLSKDASCPPEFYGWTYYLTTWALIRGKCSLWNFEDTSLMVILLNIMPTHIKLPILFTCWLLA